MCVSLSLCVSHSHTHTHTNCLLSHTPHTTDLRLPEYSMLLNMHSRWQPTCHRFIHMHSSQKWSDETCLVVASVQGLHHTPPATRYQATSNKNYRKYVSLFVRARVCVCVPIYVSLSHAQLALTPHSLSLLHTLSLTHSPLPPTHLRHPQVQLRTEAEADAA